MRNGSGWLVGLALGLGGCIVGEVPIGEDEQSIVVDPPDDEASACRTFCAAAAAVDCPRGGDCEAICERDRARKPACADRLDGFLECATTRIVPETCALHMPMPDEPIAGSTDCLGRLEEWSTCDDPAAPPRPLGTRCETRASTTTCDFGFMEAAIDATCHEGECACTIDGAVAHRCSMLLNDPLLGCCGLYFASLLVD